MVKDMAVHLEFKRTGITPIRNRQNWITRFRKRHPPLALKLSIQLECQSAYANDPDILQDYLEKPGRLIREYGLRESQIYNKDEKGFMMGLAAQAKVLCRGGRRNPRVTHDGKWELVTAIKTVAVDESVLFPFIINKGAGHYIHW